MGEFTYRVGWRDVDILKEEDGKIKVKDLGSGDVSWIDAADLKVKARHDSTFDRY